ncbi:hypothetical protein [Jatrophihabitans endophyticus]|uniref:hypothetical protein n=1 Tax=Jatrophihabitans endophyticus TaxID=1206085 RepID=UPI0019FFD7C1|nr:hypothetical protein [Jatrophihabitans endophyticus]MBE7190304.1 hypothetical protein [Jatrophihabitans endophyticus]
MKLLDAALRSADADAFLDGVQTTFEDAGRQDDALAAMVLRVLIRAREIELLMHMRAEWRQRRTPIRALLARPSPPDPDGKSTR